MNFLKNPVRSGRSEAMAMYWSLTTNVSSISRSSGSGSQLVLGPSALPKSRGAVVRCPFSAALAALSSAPTNRNCRLQPLQCCLTHAKLIRRRSRYACKGASMILPPFENTSNPRPEHPSGTSLSSEAFLQCKHECIDVPFLPVEDDMRKMTAILIGALAALILAGCVGGPYRHRSAGYVTVYYDGYYGPYSGGYWGPGGYFYYLRDNKYHRDVARHFRRWVTNTPGVLTALYRRHCSPAAADEPAPGRRGVRARPAHPACGGGQIHPPSR